MSFSILLGIVLNKIIYHKEKANNRNQKVHEFKT